jgi:hypothetical protein
MTLIGVLIFLVVLVAVAWLAHYLITSFLPAQVQMPALAVVGVILLIVLLVQFIPDIGNYRVWR